MSFQEALFVSCGKGTAVCYVTICILEGIQLQQAMPPAQLNS